MRHDRRHQFFAQAAFAVLLEDEHVGNIRERREVGDDAGETDLIVTV